LCKAVSDREIEEHIRRGADSAEAVGERCGAGTDCGSCVDDIEARICRRAGARHANHSPQARGSESTASAGA
ncbi:(2Fe-2S)-binding protein, partial [Acinetobacter baumannii]